MRPKYSGEVFYRLDMLANHFGSKRKLAQKSGFSVDALMKSQRRGYLSSRMAAKIINGTGCNKEWFLFGEGNMFDVCREKPKFIKYEFNQSPRDHAESAIRHILLIQGVPEGEKMMVCDLIQSMIRRIPNEEISNRDTDSSGH